MIKSKKDMFKFIFSIIIAAIFVFNDMNSTYGTCFLALLLSLVSIQNKKFYISKLALITSILILLSYIFSGIQTQSLENSLLLAILVVGAGNVGFDNKYRDRVIQSLSVACFAIAVYQFASQSIAAGPYVNIFDLKQQYPNALAAVSLIFLAISQSKKFTAMNALTILLTKSRFGIATMLLVLLIKNIRKVNKKVLIGMCLMVCLAFGLLANIQKSTQTVDFSSVEQRIEHWILTPKLFDYKTLLLGSGAGSFEYLFPSVQRIPLNNAPHSHNLIINILLEYGIWVLIGLITIFISLFKYQKPQTQLALVGFLLFNLVNLDYQFPLTVFILLLILDPSPPPKSLPTQAFHKLIPMCFLLITIIVPQNIQGINKVISHKDYWITQQNIDQYQAHSPLDIQAHKHRSNASQYSKQIFLNDPYKIENMVLLLDQYPNIRLHQKWYDDYKYWYLNHTKNNHSYINQKGQTQELIQAMATYDPKFSQQLELTLKQYQENF